MLEESTHSSDISLKKKYTNDGLVSSPESPWITFPLCHMYGCQNIYMTTLQSMEYIYIYIYMLVVVHGGQL